MAKNVSTNYMYSYDDFQKALAESGLGGSFSDADLRLATVNPDAGMSILNSKIGWGAATSDAERQRYNQQAENVRRQYGGYTGGGAGNLYQLEPVSPGSFSYAEAPTYQSQHNDRINGLLNQQMTYGSFNDTNVKPVYQNKYAGQIAGALDKVANPQAFSYNPETDQSYQSFAKAYRREGERAVADAMGQAAAMTGGLPSSYAATAGAQAGNYYAAQMADKIPQLEQMAHDRYMSDYAMKQAALDALMGAEAADYAKYQGDLAQYNTDRNFSYNQYLDEYNRIANDLATVRDMEQSDYGRFLDTLDQYNRDKSFSYDQLLNEIDFQTMRRAEAEQAAQRELENSLIRAEAGAAVGDYGGYRGMGYNTDYAEEMARLALEGQKAALEGDAADRQLILDQWKYKQEQDAADRAAYEREWEYQVGQDAADAALERALVAAEMGDYSQLEALGIAPNVQASGGAVAQNTNDTAKYVNFMLGYWDEPGVREYIIATTGLTPERYAEYLNKTEGANIVYQRNKGVGSDAALPMLPGANPAYAQIMK